VQTLISDPSTLVAHYKSFVGDTTEADFARVRSQHLSCHVSCSASAAGSERHQEPRLQSPARTVPANFGPAAKLQSCPRGCSFGQPRSCALRCSEIIAGTEARREQFAKSVQQVHLKAMPAFAITRLGIVKLEQHLIVIEFGLQNDVDIFRDRLRLQIDFSYV
jgi:hypothetical protein